MKTLPKIASAIICLCGLTSVLQAQVPQLINYQGRVVVGTTNFDGSGQFKFALVNTAGTTTYWSSDGTSTNGSEPTNAVTLTVVKGLYSVALGDSSLTNMTAVPGSVFSNSDVRLRVWFNDGTHGSQLLAPDQRVATVGYAFMADNIKDGAITSTKLASGAVGATQLASGAVGSANIASGAVGSTQLASSLTLAGTTTGTFSGPLTGNASTAGSATNFTGSLAGDVTGTQGATSIAATTVTGKALTGFSSTTGTITASDTVLSAINKLNGNVALKAPLASPTFTGGITLSSGVVNIPATTSFSNGVIQMGGTSLISAPGTQNLFLGNGAGNFTLTGTQNTATGASSLTGNTTGSGNTAAGVSSLTANTTGFNNTATGFQALSSNSTASNNVATGQAALLANTTGANNTAVGTSALRNNNGSSNTAIGTSALTNNSSGTNNVGIGLNAGQTITTGSNDIDIGSDAAAAAESNTIRIGTSGTHTAAFIAGTINGNGSGLTNLNASNINSGGTLPALNGSALTTLNAANITSGGTLPALNASALTTLNASSITTGTLSAAQLPASVALLTASNTFGGTQTIFSDINALKVQGAQPGVSSYMEFDNATGVRGVLGLDGQFLTNSSNQFTFGTFSNSSLAFYTNQLQRMMILGNGNVGIGTSSPTVALEVAGTIKGNGSGLTNLSAANLSGTLPALNGSALTNLNASSITTGTLPAAQIPSSVALLTASNTFGGTQTIFSDINALKVQGAQPGVSSYMEFDDATGVRGVLGIDGQFLTNSSNQFTFGTFSNSSLAFYTNQLQRMMILGNGNVGIGTSSPTVALEVAGTIKGNGSGLTNLSAANLSGTLPALNGSALTTLNASNITTGTLPAAQLPATVALRAGGNNFTGVQTFTADGGVTRAQPVTAGDAALMEVDDSTGGSVFRAFYGLDGVGLTGTANQFVIATWTNSPMAFYTNQARRMTIGANGLVGIGISSPSHGTLEVGFIGGSYTASGATGFNHTDSSFLVSYSDGTFTSAIYANGDVVTTGSFIANSDERIKNVLGRSDSARDLSTLLGIEITDYRYKDVIAHGDAPFKKVIAQQVEKVFPQAVTKQPGEVPDIYKLATIKDGWIALATDLKQGERVKLIADDAQGVYEVLEVQGGAFRTDFKPTAEKVFVYGREVKDFRNVDYDAIAMLNVSATQEMQKEIESLKADLASAQKARDMEVTTLKERLTTLEARDKDREARLTRLEIATPAARSVSNGVADNNTASEK